MTELSYEAKVAIRSEIERQLQSRMENIMRNAIAVVYRDPLLDPDARAEVLKFCERMKVHVTVEVE